jgi:outer membrane lipoprotein-sorting protein
VNHSEARRAISERMDGERLSTRASAALDNHLSACARCRAFESGAWRLREAARFGIAEPVPDLVAPIMTAVRDEAAARPPWRGRPGRTSGRAWWGALAPVAAALVVGLIAGSLSVGGPWTSGRGGVIASAGDVSDGVAAAARTLRTYQAAFDIAQIDPSERPARRRLTMNVWFQAPERFRLDVIDRTPGAGTRFAANNLQLIVNGDASYQVAPSACPIGVCPQHEQVVRNRLPFSSATPAPTDLILPVATLVDAREMEVVGHGRVMGRDAVEVRLPFERARPLFPFLDIGGTWRPFYSRDRVDLWLDARSWFPLRYAVYPAAGPARTEWELRFGLPDESPDEPIFEVKAVSIDASAPGPSTFRIPHARTSRDEGGRAATIAEVRSVVPFDPIAPDRVDGLGLYRVVLPKSEPDDALLTYASGLSWLKLGETRASSGRGFFDPVGAHALRLQLSGVGTAYYQPASGAHGRRLAIHTTDGDLYLETNLSRADLIGAAASLRITATPVPTSWLTTSSRIAEVRRVSVEQATRELPFVIFPRELPSGYTAATAEIVTVDGRPSLTIYFRTEGGTSSSGVLRLHEEPAPGLPPASAPRQFALLVRGAEGRWTPGRDQLEWVSGGIYYSLDGKAFGLGELFRVASSMPRPAGPRPSP